MEFSLQDQFKGFIDTPQIFAENSFFEYPLFQTLKPEDQDLLLNLSEPRTLVLGKRMEDFFHYYIKHFTPLQVLAHNEQIICNKQTLGELDFLLKHPTSGEVSHVELIYKLYVYDPDFGISERDHLIGPNRRDHLNRKLQRLQKGQFPLLFNDSTRELLQSIGVHPEAVVQKMCFKAQVFLPKLRSDINFSEINTSTVAGYWIRFQDFTAQIYGQNKFYSPRKKYWPVEPGRNTCWYSYDEILEQVDSMMARKFSMLLWMQDPAGKTEKFFIVWW